MTPSEAVLLVRFVSRVTPMKLEEDTAEAWHLLIGDEVESLQEAQAAVVRLAKRQTFVAANEVLAEVKAARKKALDEAGVIGAGVEARIPVGLDGRPVNPDDTRAYLAALRAGRLEAAQGTRPRPVLALVESTAARRSSPRALEARQQARLALEQATPPRPAPLGFSEAIVEMDRMLAEQRAAQLEQPALEAGEGS